MVSPRSIFVWLIVLVTPQTLVMFASSPQNVHPDTSTIVIVGTVHKANQYYDAQALCRIIERVKPDLILVELDSSFFTPTMSLKTEFVNISLENKAVAAYVQTHPVSVRPYDIEGRNRIYEQHNYFKLQREMSSALSTAERDSLLGNSADLLLDAVIRFDGIGAGFGSERPEVFNSTACDAAMESKQYYAGEGMVQIVSSVPSLAQYEDFCKFRRDFWIQRNDTMVSKISSWAKRFHAQTVLVLCGYEHRYYLVNGLEKRAAKEPFILREYWKY